MVIIVVLYRIWILCTTCWMSLANSSICKKNTIMSNGTAHSFQTMRNYTQLIATKSSHWNRKNCWQHMKSTFSTKTRSNNEAHIEWSCWRKIIQVTTAQVQNLKFFGLIKDFYNSLLSFLKKRTDIFIKNFSSISLRIDFYNTLEMWISIYLIDWDAPLDRSTAQHISRR